jgi:CheY-like chemotaxis protein
VVLLDLNLPDLPGAEVTRQLLAPSASSYRPGPCRTMSRTR